MKQKEIVNNLLKSTKNIIKHGKIDSKILLELKINASINKYIEVVTNYYDDEERPDFNNWIDVEGMGYGWRWLKYEENRWHEMMCKMVVEECEMLYKYIDEGYCLVYENERCKSYHFVLYDYFREDTIISVSNKELEY